MTLSLKYRRVMLLIAALTLASCGKETTTANQGPPPALPSNVVISTAMNTQKAQQIISDGAGGAIIVWEDARGGGFTDIYAQRLDSAGAVQWTADGVAICTAANSQYLPQLTSDGTGGAIIVWVDNRSGSRIYAQRVNSAGIPQWATDGVLVSATTLQLDPIITSDGVGGAIISWTDLDNGGNHDIRAQRLNSAGLPQWTVNGVSITASATTNVMAAQIISDGAGGAIIAWQDARGGATSIYDIYAQRVDDTGLVSWSAGGIAVCTASWGQWAPRLISDGVGGAIITWYDIRNGVDYDIYAQRIDSTGAAQWVADGVAVSVAPGHQQFPQLASDGFGGAIIVWEDHRNISPYTTYVQRINGAGVAQWMADGVAMTSQDGQYIPQIVSDGTGGAIIAWVASNSTTTDDIYAQRMNGSGVVLWSVGGVPVSTAPMAQNNPQMTSDGVGGAFFVWQDYRIDFNSDIYSQHLTASGTP